MLAKNSVSDIEKREKKVLEKKLGEMEDELKVGDSLKNGIATRKIRRSFLFVLVILVFFFRKNNLCFEKLT